MYNKAIEPVKIPFDGNSKNINLFQSQLSRKAAIAGWDVDTGNLLTIADAKRDQKTLLAEYGCITEKDIRASLVYIGTTIRSAQNNKMMVECLLASLTEGCFLKISNEEAKYTEKTVTSAALLYKLLMKKVIVDTRATTYQFRSSLDNFENIMGTINSNIELFNQHVKNTKEGLTARGESVNDLLLKLLRVIKQQLTRISWNTWRKRKKLTLKGRI